MVMSGIIGDILFIPSLFILSMFLAFFFRKRIVRKILFLEFDENVKNLAPRDFFYSILKMEKSIKSFYLAEILFLLADILFILFGGYAMYLERLEFSKKYSYLLISPASFVLDHLTLPIILWVIMFFLLLLTLFMIKKEKKRVSDMLNYLNKYNILNSAKKDFFNSDKIIKSEVILQSDIKLGDKYLFSIYTAYILPYSWIKDVKIEKVHGRGGNGGFYYLNFTLNKSFNPVRIFFAKKETAEQVKNFILKKALY